MWAASKTMEPIESQVDIAPTEIDGSSRGLAWPSITLHNGNLSQMAQGIQLTGLGSLEEVYLCIIPPMSQEDKLPRADAIIDWTRKHRKPHEQRGG